MAVFALFFLGYVALFVKRYKRCPPNRIMVIFGKVGLGAPAT
jgi:hypothetical protein